MAAGENTRVKLNEYCQSQAEKYLSEGNHTEAFYYFLTCAKISPVPEITDSLVFTLRQLGLSLEKSENYTELFDSYKKALSVLPNCPEIQNNLGAHLVRIGKIEAAVPYFLQALTLNPSFVSAKENLDNVSNTLIERWHFPMLNDKDRNKMYYAALEAAIGRGFDTVLDIGAGTGILSMYAAKCGAKKTYACEMSNLMHQIAARVLKNNKMDAKISLHGVFSPFLSIPDHLEQRVSLVVTEILDSGLLGEGILVTLDDAWERLLLPPGENQNGAQTGRVIPSGATVWATCIECESIRLQNRILKPKVCGIKLNCLTDQRAVDFVPYTTENLDTISKDVNFLSQPISVTRIDFNDPLEIKKYIDGLTLKLDVNIVQDGILDAIVVWFTLHLDETHSLSTASNTCWEQAVFPINSNPRVNDLPDTTWNLNHNDILRLNDHYYWQLIFHVFNKCDLHESNLLDLTTMPLTALNALKMNAKRVTICDKHELISHLARFNNLNEEKMMKSNHEDSATQKWDLVLMDLIEPSGILRQDILETVALLRYASKNAIFIPNQMLVQAVLVESASLLRMNRLVDDDNVLGFKIEDTINKFKVTNHIDINFKQMAHKFLCKSTQIFDFDFIDESNELTNVCNTFNMKITDDGTIHAVLFWFKLRYGNEFLDTLDHDCFYRQTCIVLEQPMAVKSGENVVIEAKCSHSCITITVQ
uniref:Uncharacterized protein n=1 Tax=Strigamia maritima TaxID=126957 RepID=T1JEL8_STRMM